MYGRSLLWPVILWTAAPAVAYSADAGDMLKFDQKFTQAVCDDALVSRAPSLDPGRDSVGPDLLASVPLPEIQLIQFLLGDSRTWVATPYMKAQLDKKGVSEPAAVAALRRKVSLDVCTAMVTPGKLAELLKKEPSWVFQATAPKKWADLPRAGRGRPSFRLKDSEARFGKSGQKWLIAGWIEAQEVSVAWTERREYRRLANPVTNRTQFIQMVGKDDLPLGFLAPAPPPVGEEAEDVVETLYDWKVLKAEAETETSKQRKIATYRMMIENEAYATLARAPKKADEIRKLQEFYRNLIGAYLLYPDDSQFAQYARRAKSMWGEREIRNALNAEWFKMLADARVNGTRVLFHYFQPDASLHGMYLDYLAKLERLAQ